MKTTDNNTEVLNDLIKINNDRTEGYEKAIKETKEIDGDLKNTFKRMADESRKYAEDLKREVNTSDKVVSNETTNPGKIYRVWMDVKTAASGNSRESVLSACEFGEDAAQNAYRDALATKDLSPNVRDVLSKQHTALKSSHDVIKQWRDKEKSRQRSSI